MKHNYTLLLKALFLFLLGINISTIYAQEQVNQVIVATGGKFEFSAPFTDKATIGSYIPYTGKYTVFDNIQVESIQGLVVNGNVAYLAAQDTIIKYDLNSNTRVAEVAHSGLASIFVVNNMVWVSEFSGTTSYLTVYNNSLTLVQSFSQVLSTVNGITQIGDSIYVGYNQKGTIDAFPPFQVFKDSIGKIGVINATSLNFIREINLDTLGAGVEKLYTANNKLYAITTTNNNVVEYTPILNTIQYHNNNIKSSYSAKGDSLFGNFKGGIGTYSFANSMVLNDSIIGGTFSKVAYDKVNQMYYGTQTDFSSYGTVKAYSSVGSQTDSVAVGISPEGIGIQYVTGLFVPVATNDAVNILKNTTLTLNFMDNDYDADNTTVTVSVLSNFSNASASTVSSSANFTFGSGFDGVLTYQPTADFTGNDTLWYKITDVGNLSDSASVIISVLDSLPTAINNLSLIASEVNFYPNPVASVLNIKSNKVISGIQLFDISGKLMKSEKGNIQQINVTNLKAGLFFSRIYFNDGTFLVKKIIKSKK